VQPVHGLAQLRGPGLRRDAGGFAVAELLVKLVAPLCIATSWRCFSSSCDLRLLMNWSFFLFSSETTS
jgi:hypothetical protein